MRGVDQRLARRFAAGNARHHIVRVDLTVRRLEREARGDSERYRGEVRESGGPAGHFEIQPGVAEERDRLLPGDPTLDLQPVYVAAGRPQIELLARPGAAHHLPRIAGRPGLVDDQRAVRAHGGGLFELVGPAAVVGHRVATEVVLPRRVVHQRHQDLAGEVGVPEVVPAVFGRLDSVTHEEQLPGGADLGHHPLRPGDEIHRRLPVAAGIRGALHRDGGRTHEGYRLDPRSVRVAGLESEFLEGAGQISDGLLLSGRGGRPAAELVRGQRGDMREEAVLVKAGPGPAAGKRQGRHQQGNGNQPKQRTKHRGFSLGREQSLPESRLFSRPAHPGGC